MACVWAIWRIRGFVTALAASSIAAILLLVGVGAAHAQPVANVAQRALLPPFAWTGWESLGGETTAAPAISSKGSGSLNLFATGTNRAVWHNWFDLRVGHWSGYEPVPGFSATATAPASASWGSGRADVFVRGTDNALWHTFYEEPSWAGNWESLGGVLTSAPAVCSRGQGRLDVFVRGIDNQLWQLFYVKGIGWQGWLPVGGTLTGAPAAACWTRTGERAGEQRVDVFVPGTDQALWHRFYTAQRGWSGWETLGGVLAKGTSPSVSSLRAGSLDIFVVGTDNALYHKWYNETAGGWSGWEVLSGKCFSGSSSTSWSPTRIDVVCRGIGNVLYHKYVGE
jgi:hypothetical protein